MISSMRIVVVGVEYGLVYEMEISTPPLCSSFHEIMANEVYLSINLFHTPYTTHNYRYAS
jgi:hypothetical protein